MRSSSLPGVLVTLGIAVVSLAPATPAAANGPSLDGVSGLLRVHSAELQPRGYVGGTVWGQYARAVYLPSESPRGQAETIKFGDTGISVGYVPSPFVELALRGSGQGQFLTSYAADVSESEFGLSEIGFGVKALLTPASRQDFRLAAELDLASSTGSSNALAGSWDSDGLDVGGRLAFTYARTTKEQNPGLRAHANAGYLNRTGDFDPAAWAVTAAGPNPPSATLHGDEFLYGLGVEMPVPHGLTAFAEWSGEYDISSEASFGDNPMRLTPGVRWSAPGGAFQVTSGLDVSLASDEASPPWGFLGAVTFGGHMNASNGTLIGVVRDAESGQPVAAAKVVARNGKAQATTDATGHFRTEVVEGYAVLEITAPGYAPKTRVVEIPGNRSVEFDFTLAKHTTYGAVNGRLQDAQTGNPVAGRVRVQGAQEWVNADPATGQFRLEKVTQGIAVLEVEAPHHRPATSEVRIGVGEVAVQEFSLEADTSAPFGVLSGTVRDAVSGKPLAATVTARGKTTKTAATDPKTGRYEIELETGPWDVSVAGSGYAARGDSLLILQNDSRTADYKLAVLPREIPVAGVMFDKGTATIKRESFAALGEAAKFLTQNPSLTVTIVGHANESTTPDANTALSQRRADAVLKYLVVNHGVDPTRLVARGLGEKVAPGTAKDRRIGS
jgi:outer membrane protein OmpA-like peptidoglycan-associated protein